MNGLWTINFRVPGRPSSMVLTFNGNQVTGGNSEYYYVGTILMEGADLKGEVTGIHYFGTPDPVFGGAKTIPLQFSAKIANDTLQGTASVASMPTPIPFIGHKVA